MPSVPCVVAKSSLNFYYVAGLQKAIFMQAYNELGANPPDTLLSPFYQPTSFPLIPYIFLYYLCIYDFMNL